MPGPDAALLSTLFIPSYPMRLRRTNTPMKRGAPAVPPEFPFSRRFRYSSIAVFIKGCRRLLVAIGGIRNELVPRHRLARLPCGRGTGFAKRSVRGWKLSIEVDPEDRVWRQPAR